MADQQQALSPDQPRALGLDKHTALDLVHALPIHHRVMLICAVFVGIAILASGARFLTPPGEIFAAWWPAAGLGVVATLCVKKLRWLVAGCVGLVTFAVFLVNDQPLSVGAIGLLATATEVLVTAELIMRGSRRAAISNVTDALWFLLAALAGALSLGLVGSVLLWFFLGVDPWDTLLSSVPSHFSATVLIVPLVLVVWSPWRTRIVEVVVQMAALAGTVIGVFAPGNTLPVSYLPLPLLMWAAFRFPFVVVLGQVLATCITVLVLTQLGGGPFVLLGTEGALPVSTLLQLYFLTLGGSVLVLAASRHERERLLARVEATDRALRLGLGEAQVGLVVARRSGDRFAVVDSNLAGMELLSIPSGGSNQLVETASGRFEGALSFLEREPDSNWMGEWDDERARHLQVRIAKIPALDGQVDYTVQVVDATTQHLAEAATASALHNERATAEALVEVYKKQDDFLASVSHELRTPIASVLGFSEVLSDSALDDEQRSQLTVISRNANRLLLLVNNILKLAELDSGSELHRAEPRSFDELMTHCLEDVTVMAASHAVTLVHPAHEGSEAATEYPTEVSQILTNLLSNAIKFTPDGGTVTLTAEESQSTIVLSVTDTGVGIPPEELDSMTEQFVRSSRSGSVGGTGLGLAIATKLAHALGGTLLLRSDGVSGTTARLTLPVHEA